MINEEIRDKEVRLIGNDGSQLGVMPLSEAMDRANAQNLDLVKIAPGAQPPVCKIMDYGKYKFEAAKREKENRKNQKTVNLKEVRITPNIDDNDLNTKMNNAAKFLKNGDKVKVTVRFRGREVKHSVLGENLLTRIEEIIKDVGTATGLLILYAVVTIVRQVVEPKIIGTSLGIHPLITLFAMVAALELFGIAGMILSPFILIVIKESLASEAL